MKVYFATQLGSEVRTESLDETGANDRLLSSVKKYKSSTSSRSNGWLSDQSNNGN
jgi:hypothetical protein